MWTRHGQIIKHRDGASFTYTQNTCQPSFSTDGPGNEQWIATTNDAMDGRNTVEHNTMLHVFCGCGSGEVGGGGNSWCILVLFVVGTGALAPW